MPAVVTPFQFRVLSVLPDTSELGGCLTYTSLPSPRQAAAVESDSETTSSDADEDEEPPMIIVSSDPETAEGNKVRSQAMLERKRETNSVDPIDNPP